MKKVSGVAGLAIPDDLAAALALDPDADRAFRALPPSHRREYLEWIEGAKKPQTRRSRAVKAAQMLLGRAK